MVKKVKNANYKFAEKEPVMPWGNGKPQNLPDGAIMRPFTDDWSMRDLIRNSPVSGIDNFTEMNENRGYDGYVAPER